MPSLNTDKATNDSKSASTGFNSSSQARMAKQLKLSGEVLFYPSMYGWNTAFIHVHEGKADIFWANDYRNRMNGVKNYMADNNVECAYLTKDDPEWEAFKKYYDRLVPAESRDHSNKVLKIPVPCNLKDGVALRKFIHVVFEGEGADKTSEIAKIQMLGSPELGQKIDTDTPTPVA